MSTINRFFNDTLDLNDLKGTPETGEAIVSPSVVQDQDTETAKQPAKTTSLADNLIQRIGQRASDPERFIEQYDGFPEESRDAAMQIFSETGEMPPTFNERQIATVRALKQAELFFPEQRKWMEYAVNKDLSEGKYPDLSPYLGQMSSRHSAPTDEELRRKDRIRRALGGSLTFNQPEKTEEEDPEKDRWQIAKIFSDIFGGFMESASNPTATANGLAVLSGNQWLTDVTGKAHEKLSSMSEYEEGQEIAEKGWARDNWLRYVGYSTGNMAGLLVWNQIVQKGVTKLASMVAGGAAGFLTGNATGVGTLAPEEALTVPGGAAIAGTLSGMAVMTGIEASSFYDSVRSMGVDHDTAVTYARGYAPLAGAVEYWQQATILKHIPGAKTVGGNLGKVTGAISLAKLAKVSPKFVQTILNNAGLKTLGKLVIESGEEGLEEILQGDLQRVFQFAALAKQNGGDLQMAKKMMLEHAGLDMSKMDDGILGNIVTEVGTLRHDEWMEWSTAAATSLALSGSGKLARRYGQKAVDKTSDTVHRLDSAVKDRAKKRVDTDFEIVDTPNGRFGRLTDKETGEIISETPVNDDVQEETITQQPAEGEVTGESQVDERVHRVEAELVEDDSVDVESLRRLIAPPQIESGSTMQEFIGMDEDQAHETLQAYGMSFDNGKLTTDGGAETRDKLIENLRVAFGNNKEKLEMLDKIASNDQAKMDLFLDVHEAINSDLKEGQPVNLLDVHLRWFEGTTMEEHMDSQGFFQDDNGDSNQEITNMNATLADVAEFVVNRDLNADRIIASDEKATVTPVMVDYEGEEGRKLAAIGARASIIAYQSGALTQSERGEEERELTGYNGMSAQWIIGTKEVDSATIWSGSLGFDKGDSSGEYKSEKRTQDDIDRSMRNLTASVYAELGADIFESMPDVSGSSKGKQGEVGIFGGTAKLLEWLFGSTKSPEAQKIMNQAMSLVEEWKRMGDTFSKSTVSQKSTTGEDTPYNSGNYDDADIAEHESNMGQDTILDAREAFDVNLVEGEEGFDFALKQILNAHIRLAYASVVKKTDAEILEGHFNYYKTNALQFVMEPHERRHSMNVFGLTKGIQDNEKIIADENNKPELKQSLVNEVTAKISKAKNAVNDAQKKNLGQAEVDRLKATVSDLDDKLAGIYSRHRSVEKIKKAKKDLAKARARLKETGDEYNDRISGIIPLLDSVTFDEWKEKTRQARVMEQLISLNERISANRKDLSTMRFTIPNTLNESQKSFLETLLKKDKNGRLSLSGGKLISEKTMAAFLKEISGAKSAGNDMTKADADILRDVLETMAWQNIEVDNSILENNKNWSLFLDGLLKWVKKNLTAIADTASLEDTASTLYEMQLQGNIAKAIAESDKTTPFKVFKSIGTRMAKDMLDNYRMSKARTKEGRPLNVSIDTFSKTVSNLVMLQDAYRFANANSKKPNKTSPIDSLLTEMVDIARVVLGQKNQGKSFADLTLSMNMAHRAITGNSEAGDTGAMPGVTYPTGSEVTIIDGEAYMVDSAKLASVNKPQQESTKSFKLSSDKKGKDQGKADLANAFIGYGAEGSSTAQYEADAKSAGIPVNEGINADSNTVAFVSVNGNNKATSEALDSTYQRIVDVLSAGGTVVMDSTKFANSKWNKSGEGVIQSRLIESHGQPSQVNGYNYWGKSLDPQQETEPSKLAKPAKAKTARDHAVEGAVRQATILPTTKRPKVQAREPIADGFEWNKLNNFRGVRVTYQNMFVGKDSPVVSYDEKRNMIVIDRNKMRDAFKAASDQFSDINAYAQSLLEAAYSESISEDGAEVGPITAEEITDTPIMLNDESLNDRHRDEMDAMMDIVNNVFMDAIEDEETTFEVESQDIEPPTIEAPSGRQYTLPGEVTSGMSEDAMVDLSGMSMALHEKLKEIVEDPSDESVESLMYVLLRQWRVMADKAKIPFNEFVRNVMFTTDADGNEIPLIFSSIEDVDNAVLPLGRHEGFDLTYSDRDTAFGRVLSDINNVGEKLKNLHGGTAFTGKLNHTVVIHEMSHLALDILSIVDPESFNKLGRFFGAVNENGEILHPNDWKHKGQVKDAAGNNSSYTELFAHTMEAYLSRADLRKAPFSNAPKDVRGVFKKLRDIMKDYYRRVMAKGKWHKRVTDFDIDAVRKDSDVHGVIIDLLGFNLKAEAVKNVEAVKQAVNETVDSIEQKLTGEESLEDILAQREQALNDLLNDDSGIRELIEDHLEDEDGNPGELAADVLEGIGEFVLPTAEKRRQMRQEAVDNAGEIELPRGMTQEQMDRARKERRNAAELYKLYCEDVAKHKLGWRKHMWKTLSMGFSLVDKIDHSHPMMMDTFRMIKRLIVNRESGQMKANRMVDNILRGLNAERRETIMKTLIYEQMLVRFGRGFSPSNFSMPEYLWDKKTKVNVTNITNRLNANREKMLGDTLMTNAYSLIRQQLSMAKEHLQRVGRIDQDNDETFFSHFFYAMTANEQRDTMVSRIIEGFRENFSAEERQSKSNAVGWTKRSRSAIDDNKGIFKRRTGPMAMPTINLEKNLKLYFGEYFSSHETYSAIYNVLMTHGMTKAEWDNLPDEIKAKEPRVKMNLSSIIKQFHGDDRGQISLDERRKLKKFLDPTSSSYETFMQYKNQGYDDVQAMAIALNTEQITADTVNKFVGLTEHESQKANQGVKEFVDRLNAVLNLKPGIDDILKSHAGKISEGVEKNFNRSSKHIKEYVKKVYADKTDAERATIEKELKKHRDKAAELKSLMDNVVNGVVSPQLSDQGLKYALEIAGIDTYDDGEFYLPTEFADQIKSLAEQKDVTIMTQLVRGFHKLFAGWVLFGQGLTFNYRNLISDNTHVAFFHHSMYADQLANNFKDVQRAAQDIMGAVQGGVVPPTLQMLIDSNQMSIGQVGGLLGDTTRGVMGVLAKNVAEGNGIDRSGEITRRVWEKTLEALQADPQKLKNQNALSRVVKIALVSSGLNINDIEGGFAKKVSQAGLMPWNWIATQRALSECRELIQRTSLSYWLHGQMSAGKLDRTVVGAANRDRIEKWLYQKGAGQIVQQGEESVIKIDPEGFKSMTMADQWYLAAFISSEAFLDYEDIGPYDRILRTVAPFWQYVKGDTRRYVHHFINHGNEEQNRRWLGYGIAASKYMMPVLAFKVLQGLVSGVNIGVPDEPIDPEEEESLADRIDFVNAMTYIPLLKLKDTQFRMSLPIGQVESLSRMGFDQGVQGIINAFSGRIPEQYSNDNAIVYMAREFTKGAADWSSFQFSPLIAAARNAFNTMTSDPHERYQNQKDWERWSRGLAGSTGGRVWKALDTAVTNAYRYGEVGDNTGEQLGAATANYFTIKTRDTLISNANNYRHGTLPQASYAENETLKRVWPIKRDLYDALYDEDYKLARGAFDILTKIDEKYDRISNDKRLVQYLKSKSPYMMWKNSTLARPDGVSRGADSYETFDRWKLQLNRNDKMNVASAYRYYEILVNNAAYAFYGDQPKKAKRFVRYMTKPGRY